MRDYVDHVVTHERGFEKLGSAYSRRLRYQAGYWSSWSIPDKTVSAANNVVEVTAFT